MIDDTFPQQLVRTRGFGNGRPGHLQVSPDGQRVLFLRSAGDDPVQALWSFDPADGSERLLADPAALHDETGEVPAEERARRERSRETGGGITAYATDEAMRRITFTTGGRLWFVDEDGPRELPAAGPVIDPRLDPAGRRIAYVARGALRVIDADGNNDRALAEPEGADVTYGLAEYVAGEELGRDRGHWWSPDGELLLVARVDDSALQTWYAADPASPTTPAVAMRYPLAGAANSEVGLWLIGLDGSRVEVDWRRDGYEYLVAVHWDRHGLLVVVQTRAQTTMTVLGVDPVAGVSEVVRTDEDAAWVPVVAGVPARLGDGRLVWAVETADTRHLLVGGEPVTPPGLQLREVLGTDGGTVLFSASTEPAEAHLFTWSSVSGVRQVTTEPGVYTGSRSGGTLAITADTMTGAEVVVRRDGGSSVTIRSYAESPIVTPRVDWLRAGADGLRTAVLLPAGHLPGSGPLPVLMDPYGGPGGQRVLAMRNIFLVSQWFADLGFAVVVADGHGTPGRGPAWDRSVHQPKADPALEDQIIALQAAAETYPDLDLDRVGIRGWSYGGFLAAMAVLRRPDVFHAAVAGAPVTEQRLYNTHYQEKYLGHPDEHPEAYDRATLIGDAPNLTRPLMLIHGLADDNVAPAHTLRLSAALLAAGKPHTVLPLPGVTHLGATAAAAGMLVLQARFLLDALGS